MPHPDLQSEQAYIDNAYERLAAMRDAAQRRLEAVLDQGKGGTHQARQERDVIVRTSLQRLDQLEIGRHSLCFGRIDRAASDGTGNAGPGGPPGDTAPSARETFYIGRLAVSGADHEPLVVDWRAPIAEPFYRATARHPMGLVRRRHFSTDGRRLLGIEDELLMLPSGEPSGEDGLADGDTEGRVGSGALLAALERSRSGHMRDIVATVQREQDEIIRAPLPGVVVVQGGPGTGKTAVALHRAAYLLYTHRFPLERQGLLVVGPNRVFLRYIEQVLPSLGENGVVLGTAESLVSGVEARGSDDPDTAALKGRIAMATLIGRAVRDRQRPLARDVEVPFGSAVLRFTVQDSTEVVSSVRRRSGAHNSRRRQLETLVGRRLLTQYRQSLARVGGERVTTLELEDDEFISEVRRVPALAEALDRMWPRLRPEELLHDLYGAPPLLRLAGRRAGLDDAELRALHRRRSSSLDEIPWSVADLPLIDEARVLLGPVSSGGSGGEDEPRSYGHIVVDEAQDLSPMQLRMVSRRSLSGSMTVVGDLAQATGPVAPTTWADVVAHLAPGRSARTVELSVNYRTPDEVMKVSSRVLEAAAPLVRPPRSARVTGEEPALVAADSGRLVAEVVAHADGEAARVRGGTVGIVAPRSLAPALADGLRRAGLSFGEARRDGLDFAITVVPVEVVKGLEFDSVVVVEPAVIVDEEPQGLRALYVALTRATRRLTVVHERPLPSAMAPSPGSTEPVGADVIGSGPFD
ncbi:MAG TPA: ATP-binding domain-containing protein [Acidimicrobiales bacterium]